MLNALIPKVGGGAGPGAGGHIPRADFKQKILVTGFRTVCSAEPPRILGCHAAGGAVTKPTGRPVPRAGTLIPALPGQAFPGAEFQRP